MPSQPMVIPLPMALFDHASGSHRGEQLIVLDQTDQSFSFPGFATRPVLSINRGFTAPVIIERAIPRADLLVLAAHEHRASPRVAALQGAGRARRREKGGQRG